MARRWTAGARAESTTASPAREAEGFEGERQPRVRAGHRHPAARPRGLADARDEVAGEVPGAEPSETMQLSTLPMSRRLRVGRKIGIAMLTCLAGAQ